MAMADRFSRRLHPRLRSIRNGSADVNLLRSDQSSIVATAMSAAPQAEPITKAAFLQRDLALGANVLESFSETRRQARSRLKKRPKLKDEAQATRSYVNVFVELVRSGEGDDVSKKTIRKLEALAARDDGGDIQRRGHARSPRQALRNPDRRDRTLVTSGADASAAPAV